VCDDSVPFTPQGTHIRLYCAMDVQILRAQREATYGIKLIRKASNWSVPNRTAQPSAANELTAVRHRRLKTIPVTQATPITNVMAISIGEK